MAPVNHAARGSHRGIRSAWAQWTLIARFEARAARRTAGEHLFTLFFIAPMIVTGFYFTLRPVAARFAGWLTAAGGSDADWDAAARLVCLALIAAGVPAAERRIFAVRSPRAYLDGLPVSRAARFAAAAAGQIAANVPTWLIALGAAAVAAEAGGAGSPSWTSASAFVQIAFLQTAAATALTRLGPARPLGWFAGGAAGLVLIATAWRFPALSPWIAPIAAPAAALRAMFSAAEPVFAGPLAQAAAIAGTGVVAAAAYWAWRDAWIERAAETAARRRRLLRGGERLLAGRFGRPTAALVVRDLRLTARAFSLVVWTAAAAALLFQTAVAVALRQGAVGERWRAAALLFACSLSCFSLSALAPLLLAHQRSAAWIELAAGVEPTALWKAKSRYAMIAALPAWAATTALGLWAFGATGEAAYLAFRAGLVWMTVSTVIGGLAFEIADSPALGLLLGGLFGVGLSGVYLLDAVWPLGLFLYAYLMHYVVERAEAKAAAMGMEA